MDFADQPVVPLSTVVPASLDEERLTLAVVRQDQISALAAVDGRGREWSLFLSPALAAGPRPHPGDLVAIQSDRIVYLWRRALVLRPGGGSVRVRLSSGEQAILPTDPVVFPAEEPLLVGDSVFAGPAGIVARAWPWYEPQMPSAALVAHAERAVAAATGSGPTSRPPAD